MLKYIVVVGLLVWLRPPNQPQRCILTDYFNNYNFSQLKQYAPWWWWLNRNM